MSIIFECLTFILITVIACVFLSYITEGRVWHWIHTRPFTTEDFTDDQKSLYCTHCGARLRIGRRWKTIRFDDATGKPIAYKNKISCSCIYRDDEYIYRSATEMSETVTPKVPQAALLGAGTDDFARALQRIKDRIASDYPRSEMYLVEKDSSVAYQLRSADSTVLLEMQPKAIRRRRKDRLECQTQAPLVKIATEELEGLREILNHKSKAGIVAVDVSVK